MEIADLSQNFSSISQASENNYNEAVNDLNSSMISTVRNYDGSNLDISNIP
jgi:hypothetical protein